MIHRFATRLCQGILVLAAAVALAGCAAPSPSGEAPAPALAAPAAPVAGLVARPDLGAERIETLPNGLRVIVRERHMGGVASFRIYLAAGSLNEGPLSGSGVSHLLEHVVSGGATNSRSEDQIRDALSAIGAQTNAYTTKQFVCYFGEAGADHVKDLVQTIAEYVMNCRLALIAFDREFKVVQREIERAETDPDHMLGRLADETFFLDHPARNPVLGYPEVFRGLSRNDVWDYYKRVAAPDSAVAVAVGDFDGAEVMKVIRETMGGWARNRSPVTVLPDRMPQVAPRYAERRMDVASVRRILEFPTVRLTHPDLYPLDILAFVLGEGRSSRLVADLREARSLVQTVACWSDTPAGYDGGRFAVYMVSEPGKAAEAREAALAQLYRVAEGGITEEELARAKRQKISEQAFGLQTCEDIATDMGSNLLLVGDAHFSDHYVENIQKVTAADVKRVAARYLRPEVLCETVVKPEARPGPASPGHSPATPGGRPAGAGGPAEPAAKEVRPTVSLKTLPNGVRVLLCPVEGYPTVSIQMCLRGGLSIESEKDAGTSQFLARMLLKGTGSKSAADVARAVDVMGAEMHASSGRNTIYLSAQCLAGDFQETLDLAAASLLEPSLDADEIEKVRTQMLAELDQMEDTPQGEAELFFLRSFFKESPYRFPVQGRPEVVRAMTRQDLATWHKKLVTAGNVVVAVFGGVDSDKALERAARAFEKLPAGPAPEFPKNARGREVGSREVAIRPTKKDIAVVYVAYPGFDIYNLQDRFPMDVLDTILSGYQMPGGWLHNELRGKGLVYEVHAYSMAGLRPGYFTAYALCRPDKAPEVVRIIEQNMERATKEKFTEPQIVPARATVITAKELARETLAGWSLEAAIDECFGLGYGFAREEIEGLRKVTPENLSRVARWYLRQPVICVVTSDPTAAESLRQ